MDQGQSTRLTTALVLAAVFGSGLLLGLAADSGAVANAAEVSTPSEEVEDRGRRYTFEEVNPSDDQLTLIDVIVEEYRSERHALRDRLENEYRPQHRELLVSTRERIKAVLTPEQATAYQALLDEYERERDARADDEEEADEGN